MKTLRRVAIVVAVAAVAWMISGTALSVDRSAGVVVVGGMGPSRIKDGILVARGSEPAYTPPPPPPPAAPLPPGIPPPPAGAPPPPAPGP